MLRSAGLTSSGAALLFRSKLSADQTVNVPTDFATLVLALAYAATIDFNGHTLTIQLANGTYTGPPQFIIPVTVGQASPSNLLIRGDPVTPSNVVIASSTNFVGTIEALTGARCRVQGLQFTGLANGFGIHAGGGGYIEYTACDFNSGLFAGCASESGGSTACVGTLTVSAGMIAAVYAPNGGYAFQIGSVVTTANTPAFVGGYAFADGLGYIRIAGGTTFGGTGATGPRFASQRNSVIDVSGAGLTYLPGNASGTTATGGLYS